MALEIRKQGLQEGPDNINEVLVLESLPYIPEVIKSELISTHHDDPLLEHFGINRNWKLIVQKYYWSTLIANEELYMKECNVCLVLKVVRHKLYNNLQLLAIPTHRWKDVLIDFVKRLSIPINWKTEPYNSTLVIFNFLTKTI